MRLLEFPEFIEEEDENPDDHGDHPQPRLYVVEGSVETRIIAFLGGEGYCEIINGITAAKCIIFGSNDIGCQGVD
jgi:hypothetical protein